MIIARSEFAPGQALRADVCVVGGGPAAISLAMRLATPQRTVILLTGGGWSETAANQDLHRGIVAPAGSHEPLEENRRRQFGGASAVWGGRCLPFEPLDFEQRDWVPDSGWPFSYEDLLPYYREAGALCQIGEFDFNAHSAFPHHTREILPGLDSPEIVSYPLERWSPPVNFAKFNEASLARNPSIQVLLDAHVLALALAPASNRIGSVRATMQNRELTVAAGCFVLAAGGIENPRLLLASANAAFPAGLGNQHDNVGRYYMAHLNGAYAEVAPREGSELWADFERDAEGVYCRRRWWLPSAAQEDHRLLNTIFFLYHPRTQTGHRDVVFSSRFVAKSLLFIARQRSMRAAVRKARELSPGLREHSANVARHGLGQMPELIQLSLKRAAKRRLPFLLPSKQNRTWGLYFQAEQAPHRESRVELSRSESDAFGMPRARVTIRFRPADLNSVVRAHALFIANFREKTVGSAVYSEEGLRRYLDERVLGFNSAAHHLGTTRLSDDARTGVVDRNAKVYGLDNLYIAGSSVFPTGSHANPTLTIVAHALMLADHLKRL